MGKWESGELVKLMKALDESGMRGFVKRNTFISYVLDKAFSVLLTISPKKDCTGVYFLMKNSDAGLRTILSMQIGSIPEEKKDLFEKFANKKIDFLYPLVKYADSQAFSASKQCCDPYADEWGGAIAFHSVYYSISGHTEAGDEALSIIASLARARTMACGENEYMLTLNHAASIINNSDNKIAEELIKIIFE